MICLRALLTRSGNFQRGRLEDWCVERVCIGICVTNDGFEKRCV